MFSRSAGRKGREDLNYSREWKHPIQDFQKKELEKVEIAEEILKNARTEICLSMRFFNVSLSMLRPEPASWCPSLATDGKTLFFSPTWLIETFQERRVKISRLYLHQVFHCLFCHPWKREDRDSRLYDLSCDLVAEALLDSMYAGCVYLRPNRIRKEWYARLKKRRPVLTCENVYHELENSDLGEEQLCQLLQEFHRDSHEAWEAPKNKGVSFANRQKEWEDQRNRVQTDMEFFSKEASKAAGTLASQLAVENRKRYDYRSFLRKFAVLQEELQVDGDSFDYIFYHYGMELYGNMPLMEPLETREAVKIQDFVIVIDTSMSCKGELVKRFLRETYGILSERESFFRKVNIHVIQCDEKIQEDVRIQSREEMEAYMKEFTLKGFGGTDFRPAFAYVESLRKANAFHKLKGLLYFTDGRGIYPANMPSYDTAFVFLQEDYQDVDVPPWAMKLIIDREELEKDDEY